VRDFVTPELKTNKTYFYTLKSRWKRNGVLVETTREVPVSRGARVVVDLFGSER
jgi:uncharacterized protein (TIGR03000 family)